MTSTVIGLIVFFTVLWFLVLRPMLKGYVSGRTGDSLPSPKTAGPAKFHWPPLGDFEFEVVGESNYQRQLAKIVGDHGKESVNFECVATLSPEDDNDHDPKAIAVDISGGTVGYFSRDDARSFRRRLTQKGFSGLNTTCNAVIVGGGVRRNGEKLFYGIRLDIKPFE